MNKAKIVKDSWGLSENTHYQEIELRFQNLSKTKIPSNVTADVYRMFWISGLQGNSINLSKSEIVEITESNLSGASIFGCPRKDFRCFKVKGLSGCLDFSQLTGDLDFSGSDLSLVKKITIPSHIDKKNVPGLENFPKHRIIRAKEILNIDGIKSKVVSMNMELVK